VARLIIAVDAVGVRAIAGPLTAAAVLYDTATPEPVFEVADARGPRRYSLCEPKKIPPLLLPHVVAHIRKTALSCTYVHRAPATITAPKATAWAAMGQAAARAAERAVHQNLAACQVGSDDLELYIPHGGHCPYVLVGRVGQRAVAVDWRRGAAYVIAREAHLRALRSLHERFPQYGFEQNTGHASRQHLKALRRYGRTTEHRSPA